jgi:hypothetical protein
MRFSSLRLACPVLLGCLPVLCAAAGLDPAQDRALVDVRMGRTPVWDGLSREQYAELRKSAADYLDRYQSAHEPHGYTANLHWADRDRTELLAYGGLGDGAIWTGHYLAALAFHYAVEPSQELLGAIADTLAAIDLLTRVTGKEGYIARYLGPASDPWYQPYYAQYGDGPSVLRPGLGTQAYLGAPPHAHLVWLGNSSRDTYDGIHFGLAAVWREVGDPAIRAQVRVIVERVGKALTTDHFLLLDGQGHIQLPNPSFYCAWLRLMLTVCPDTFRNERPYYDFGVWLFFVVDWLIGPGLHPVDESRYYPNNLDLARMFTLCTMEENPERRMAYQKVLRRNYRDDLATHLNAHFAAIYLFATGDRGRGAIATLEGCLADFPPDKFLHVPEPVDAPTATGYADQALFVRQRPMSDFIWQRPPARFPKGPPSATEYPGIDFLLPYWMGRAMGLIAAP